MRTRTGTLQLLVYRPDVIRVHFLAAGAPPSSVPGLAVIGRPATTPWRLAVTSEEISLVTPSVQARVNRQTGAVRFLNAKGGAVLAELPGGRQLSAVPPRTTPGVDAGPMFQAVQQFALPAGEDIYGLGQHQDGDMSYRHRSVTLLQQNREVGIPFLVSSRGYGVLWDNPSVTRVDVGAEPGQAIPAGALYGESGKPGGLTARYYTGPKFDTLVTTRTDRTVDFDWSQTPPQNLPHDNYSVRWTGYLQARQGGDYTLQTASDDGVRLWVDDQLRIDDWNDHAVKTDSTRLHLDANSRHKIRLEYYQGRYDARVRLAWALPGTAAPLSLSSESAPGIDYYFLYGPSLDRVIASYRELTGAAPMPPKWALGYWQSKERYKSQQELLDIVGQYRAQHIPLDVIVQDWQYWSPHPWGSHEFDAARYPDPTKMMTDLHAENAHLMISVWAKFDTGIPNANELASVGGLYPQVIHYVFPPGQGQWYDPFNPAARRVYWQQISRQLFSHGIDGWWLDASEPELSGNWGEFRGFKTAAGPGYSVFNAYPLEHTRAIYEGQRAETGSKRVVILTRSAYAGQQRYGAATWSGDITGSWKVFANQIPAGLNFCLSGIPYWTTDIGGFFVPHGTYPGGSSDPAYRELFTRWFEYGAFCPLFRVHGTDTSKELWRFGPETEPILVKYDDLRYRLMPYIYSQAWQVTHGGSTLMRALVMDFPNDVAARDSADEFLFGPSLLVCPVTTRGASTRSVHLPAGVSWIDFWTGQRYSGGRTIQAPAPIETLPLYVRAGAIVPMGPVVQFANEKPADPIELRIYPGANGSFTLYEDEGDGYGYEKGRYATIPLQWNDATKTLTIGKRSGSYPGMPATRPFRIVVVRAGHGAGTAETTASADQTVTYHGQTVRITMPR